MLSPWLAATGAITHPNQHTHDRSSARPAERASTAKKAAIIASEAHCTPTLHRQRSGSYSMEVRAFSVPCLGASGHTPRCGPPGLESPQSGG